MGVTATRSSTTEPMLVGDAFRARDPNVTDKVAFRTWTTGDLVVRRCAVQEELDGPFRETLYVSPVLDATRAHNEPPPRYAAPFCGGSGAPYRVGLE